MYLVIVYWTDQQVELQAERVSERKISKED